MVSIGILLFPGFQMLSLGTSTVFEFANFELDQPFYRVDLLSECGFHADSDTHSTRIRTVIPR